jgi:hypothetical protein
MRRIWGLAGDEDMLHFFLILWLHPYILASFPSIHGAIFLLLRSEKKNEAFSRVLLLKKRLNAMEFSLKQNRIFNLHPRHFPPKLFQERFPKLTGHQMGFISD